MTKLRHRALKYLVRMVGGLSALALLSCSIPPGLKADLKRQEFLPTRSFSSSMSDRIPLGQTSAGIRALTHLSSSSPRCFMFSELYLRSSLVTGTTHQCVLIVRSDSRLETGSPQVFLSSLAPACAGLIDHVLPQSMSSLCMQQVLCQGLSDSSMSQS